MTHAALANMKLEAGHMIRPEPWPAKKRPTTNCSTPTAVSRMRTKAVVFLPEMFSSLARLIQGVKLRAGRESAGKSLDDLPLPVGITCTFSSPERCVSSAGNRIGDRGFVRSDNHDADFVEILSIIHNIAAIG